MAATAAPRGDVLEVGPLEISPDEHLARAGGMLRLSIRELRLLTELARHLDRIVSRDELLPAGVGPDHALRRSLGGVCIRKLRMKLNVALPEWSFIHTHFGLGYRLSAEARASGQVREPALSSPTMATEISQPVNN
jgi:DNA-binding response OmpR family regulator